MFITAEQLVRYNALKKRAEAKENARKEREKAFKDELRAELESEFGQPEEELETLREALKAEVPLGKSITLDGVGEVKYEERLLSWNVTSIAAFAEWAVNNARAEELLDVKKANVNKVCNGAKLGGFGVPAGVEPKLTKVLEVKIFD